MAQHALAIEREFTRHEIKQFGAASGVCITIILPVNIPGRADRSISTRLKVAIGKVQEKLAERLLSSATVSKLVDSLTEVSEQLDEESHAETLLLFCSEDEQRHYWVADKVDEAIVVADNFYVRPFLPKIEGERNFYLLALSQKNIRLLRCTEHSSEEVDLGERIPHSLLEDMATDQPDHVLDNRSSAGPSVGSPSKGVMFGTSTDREDRDEYLAHFYKDVSKGISEYLRGQEKTPLVLCGVEYELALYARVNTWENTCPEGVRGAPNGLKGGEMHSRALECLDKMYQIELDELIAQHGKQAGDLAAAGVNDIVKFAYDGRVMHLFVADKAQVMGNFDEASHRARTHQVARSGDEDLINAAAVQTIVHAGRVHAMPQAKIPGNRPMAALMRY